MGAELMASNLVAHWVQSGLVACASLIALGLFKVTDPRLRLASLQCVLLLIVLLPWIQPRQTTEAPTASPTSDAPLAAPVGADADAIAISAALLNDPDALTASHAALTLVIAGVALRLLWLGWGLLTLQRFTRRATIVAPPDVAEDLQTQLGVSSLYVEQPRASSPSTFGFFQSTIALPAGFYALDRIAQQAVVCHELLHVKRRDAAIVLAEELVVAAVWFHPWIWLVRSRIRVAREQVVDRRVVKLVGNRSRYVRCLVEMAGHDLAPHLGAGLLRSRELRARIDAMLQEVHMSRARFAAACAALIVTAGMASWIGFLSVPLRAAVVMPENVDQREADPLLSVRLNEKPAAPTVLVERARPPEPMAATRPARNTFETRRAGPQAAATSESPRRPIQIPFAEYPLDALEKGIHGTVDVELTVNAAGDVTTAVVVSGPQELRASAQKAAFGLKYSPGSSTDRVDVSVVYSQRAGSWGATIVPRIQSLGSISAGPPQPDASGAYRIGGQLRPPRRIRNVSPVYPEAANDANVQGVVIIEARIAEDGRVTDTRALRSIPLLDEAALDAVKQWEYEPTYLNGMPVPVLMTVTVNFTLRRPDRMVLRIRLEGTATVFTIPNGGMITVQKDGSKFGFVPLVEPGSASSPVRVAIYDMTRATPGQAPILLGHVDVTPGGGVVYSPTIPSFGVQLSAPSR